MPLQILFSQPAQEDLQEIYDWYEHERTGLGEIFLQAIDISVEKILVTPTAATTRYDNIRCRLVKHFPYLLHYSYDELTAVVVIHRIFHTSRKPFWDR